jgi:hypothetical protein
MTAGGAASRTRYEAMFRLPTTYATNAIVALCLADERYDKTSTGIGAIHARRHRPLTPAPKK